MYLVIGKFLFVYGSYYNETIIFTYHIQFTREFSSHYTFPSLYNLGNSVWRKSICLTSRPGVREILCPHTNWANPDY